MLSRTYRVFIFLLSTKERKRKSPNRFSVNIALKDLLKPFKNYGAMTLKNIFTEFEIFTDSSIINYVIKDISYFYLYRGR